MQAKRYQTSRSELYSWALNAFIGRHTPDEVTQAMGAALDAIGNEPDAFAAEAARWTLASTDW